MNSLFKTLNRSPKNNLLAILAFVLLLSGTASANLAQTEVAQGNTGQQNQNFFDEDKIATDGLFTVIADFVLLNDGSEIDKNVIGGVPIGAGEAKSTLKLSSFTHQYVLEIDGLIDDDLYGLIEKVFNNKKWKDIKTSNVDWVLNSTNGGYLSSVDKISSFMNKRCLKKDKNTGNTCKMCENRVSVKSGGQCNSACLGLFMAGTSKMVRGLVDGILFSDYTFGFHKASDALVLAPEENNKFDLQANLRIRESVTLSKPAAAEVDYEEVMVSWLKKHGVRKLWLDSEKKKGTFATLNMSQYQPVDLLPSAILDEPRFPICSDKPLKF